jgi:hypothetical protein
VRPNTSVHFDPLGFHDLSLIGAGAQPAGIFLDKDRVRRNVVSDKVIERDTLYIFATDVLMQNITHLHQSWLECQSGAQACQTTIHAPDLTVRRVS